MLSVAVVLPTPPLPEVMTIASPTAYPLLSPCGQVSRFSGKCPLSVPQTLYLRRAHPARRHDIFGENGAFSDRPPHISGCGFSPLCGKLIAEEGRKRIWTAKRLPFVPDTPNDDLVLLHQYRVSETYALHRHEFYEVFYVLRGQALHEMDGSSQVVSEGTLVFIRPDDAHCYKVLNCDDFEFVNVNIAGEPGRAGLSLAPHSAGEL